MRSSTHICGRVSPVKRTHRSCLPAVPGVLDAVLEALGTEQVAEITGRSRRVIRRDGRRVVERRSASAAKAETDAFMSGKKRVLVFSDAGGTGRSYHADLGVANQQRRVHYLVEPGWRADAAIHPLGALAQPFGIGATVRGRHRLEPVEHHLREDVLLGGEGREHAAHGHARALGDRSDRGVFKANFVE